MRRPAQDQDLNVVVSIARTGNSAWPITTRKNDQGKTAALGDGPTGMPSWTDDFDGSRAEQYGYVNRVMADDELDEEVNRIASPFLAAARFDAAELRTEPQERMAGPHQRS